MSIDRCFFVMFRKNDVSQKASLSYIGSCGGGIGTPELSKAVRMLSYISHNQSFLTSPMNGVM